MPTAQDTKKSKVKNDRFAREAQTSKKYDVMVSAYLLPRACDAAVGEQGKQAGFYIYGLSFFTSQKVTRSKCSPRNQ